MTSVLFNLTTTESKTHFLECTNFPISNMVFNTRFPNSVQRSLGSKYRWLSRLSLAYTATVFLKNNTKVENL